MELWLQHGEGVPNGGHRGLESRATGLTEVNPVWRHSKHACIHVPGVAVLAS